MFEEMFGSLILEIEHKSELYMETGSKLGIARNDMKKAIELANALSERYGSKYSFEGSAAERPYSKEEIDAIKDATDKQLEKLDKQIELLTKTLEY